MGLISERNGNVLPVVSYVVSDWASDLKDRKSSGCLVEIFGNIVALNSNI